jgi:hypothetical protein
VPEFLIEPARKGWFNYRGEHRGHQNTYTGLTNDDPYIPGRSTLLRSFFVFDLSRISVGIASAKLRFEIENYFSPNASESISVFHVASPPSSFGPEYRLDSPQGIEIFDDLGNGPLFGTFNIARSQHGSIVDFNLSDSAIPAINNSRGREFVLGLDLGLPFMPNVQRGIRFSNGHEGERVVNQLILKQVPEPSAVLLVAFGFIVVTVALRNGRK